MTDNKFDYELRFDESEVGGTGCWSYYGILTDCYGISNILVRVDRGHDHDVAKEKALELVKRWNAYEKIMGLNFDAMKVDHGATDLYLSHEIETRNAYNQAIDDIKSMVMATIGGK